MTAWYLGDHASPLFDGNGNAGPTVWAGGRVVGGWAQTAHGDVAVKLFDRVDAPNPKDDRRRM
ncbi:MAG: DNA glycosylase AlkZ-like family protein [Acidimicrobiia bacterium]